MTEKKEIICPYYPKGPFGSDGSCAVHIHRAGVLTDHEIKLFNLIPDSSENCFKGTSYNLRLGEGHRVDTKGRKGPSDWSLHWINPHKDKLYEKNKINPTFIFKEYLEIKPFDTALIQLMETVDTKKCVEIHDTVICGRFDLRLSAIAKGLTSQQATQIEPLYNGKLFCYLTNTSSVPIKLYYNEEIATIEFSYISCSIHSTPEVKKQLLEKINKNQLEKYQEYGKERLFCNKYGIDDVRYFGKYGKLPSPGTYLDKKIETTVNEQIWGKIKTTGVLLAAGVGFLIILIWLYGDNWIGNYLKGKADQYWRDSAPERERVLNNEVDRKIDEVLEKRKHSKEKGRTQDGK